MTISALKRCQVAREATAGTKVAATAKIPGKLTMEEKMVLHRPEEERGSLASNHRTVLVGESVEMAFEGDLTFEQIMWWLASGIHNRVYGDTANPTGAKHNDNGVYTNLTNAFDGAPGTSVTIVTFTAAQDYIQIRSASKFRAVRVDIGGTPNALASTISAVHFSDGASGWLAGTLVRDGTLSGAGTASLAQDGVIEFTPHASWLSDTVDGDAGFWVRITWNGNWTASVVILDFYTIPFVTVWTYDPSLTAANTPQSLTVEYGDNTQEHEAEYGIVSDLEFSWAMDEPMKVKASLFGRNMAASTFTSLSDPTGLETAIGNKTRLYINATGGTIGSTEKTSTIIDGSIKLETGFKSVKHGTANLFSMDGLAENKKQITADMTLVFNSGVETERTMYAAGTRRLFRVQSTGSLISGSDYKSITFDFAGVYTKFSTLEEKDGETTVSVTIEGEYDATWAKLFTVVVQNTTGALA